MVLIIKGHDFKFELENICRLFLPLEKITVIDQSGEATDDSGITAVSVLKDDGGRLLLYSELTVDGRTESAEEQLDKNGCSDKEIERKLSVQMYSLLVKHFNFTLPWGAVTGVRPVKLMRRHAAEKGREEAARWFLAELLVSGEKTRLCLDVLDTQSGIIPLSRPDSFSLYISIPFCPSRCDYCSFVSHTVERAAKLVPAYVDNLCKEIEHNRIAALELRLETIYIGGVPTSRYRRDKSRTDAVRL